MNLEIRVEIGDAFSRNYHLPSCFWNSRGTLCDSLSVGLSESPGVSHEAGSRPSTLARSSWLSPSPKTRFLTDDHRAD
jgi:hypothetical protein